MKKFTKVWTAMTVSLLFTLLLTFMAAAESYPITGSIGPDLTYSLDENGVMTISGTGAMDNDLSSMNNTRLPLDNAVQVIVEEGVTTIDDYAFGYNSQNLTSISLPGTLVSIGAHAFEGCVSLARLDIPDSVSSIGSMAFNNCNAVFYANIGSDGAKALGRLSKSFRDERYPGLNLKYSWSGDHVSGLTFIADTDIQNAVIPEEVTSISSNAFKDRVSLETVTIPSTVSAVPDNAFSGCTSLTSIVIPGNITQIGASAFAGCTGLTEITLSDGVGSLGNSVFSGCSALTRIDLPDSASVSRNTFADCDAVVYARLGSNAARSAGMYGVFYDERYPGIAFRSNSSGGIYFEKPASDITEFDIPEGVTYIASDTFDGYTQLTRVSIPDSVTSIGERAFRGCSALSTLTLPVGLESIGAWAFNGCTSLTQVTLPDSVTIVGANAFNGCSGLQSLQLSEGMTEIQMFVFQDCSALQSLVIPESIETISNGAFYNCTSLASVTLPVNLRTVGPAAFENCSSLTEVTLPDGITGISSNSFGTGTGNPPVSLYSNFGCDTAKALGKENRSFRVSAYPGLNFAYHFENETEQGMSVYGDKDIVTAVIPAGVTQLNNYAFQNCTALTSIELPEGVISIGQEAFSGCTSLSQVLLPDSLSEIGGAAFQNCSSLTGIVLPDNLVSIAGSTFKGCSSMTTLTLPSGLETIGAGAFYGCSALTRIELPETVTTIGDNAFYGCPRESFSAAVGSDEAKLLSKAGYSFRDPDYPGIDLKYLYNGDTVTDFIVCNSDTDIVTAVIPEGVTCIGYDPANNILYPAFNRRQSLTSVTMPGSVTRIGYTAFAGCTSLENLVLPANVTTIEAYAFSGCTALRTLTLPQNLVTIGGSAFNGCESLQNLTLPEHLAVIAGGAFNGCSSLTEITVPASVTSIGSAAFSNCGLTQVTLGAGVTEISEELFDGCADLTGITVSEGLTTIGINAFRDCSAFTTISCLDGLTTIDVQSFGPFGKPKYMYAHIGSTGAKTLSKTEWFDFCDPDYPKMTFRHRFDGEEVTGLEIRSVEKDIVTAVVPAGVTAIPANAFKDCTSLTSITLPASVTSIGVEAFANCISLGAISLPENLTGIGNSAFSGCSALTELDIPGTVSQIGDGTFAGCTGLTQMTLPAGLVEIGSSVFRDCANLGSVLVPDAQVDYSGAFHYCDALLISQIGSEGAKCLGKANYCFRDPDYPSVELKYEYTSASAGGELIGLTFTSPASDVETFEIPEGVTYIRNRAFAGYTALTQITLPSTLVSIGEYAFEQCTGLTAVTLPQSVTDVGTYAFSRCSGLTSLVLSGSMTAIKNNAFSQCIGLTSLTIPEGIESIGVCAFTGCSGLTQLTLPQSLRVVQSDAFNNCTGLTEIVVPDGVTTIDSNNVFGYVGSTHPILYATIGSDASKALSRVGYTFRDPAYPQLELQYSFTEDEATDLKIAAVAGDKTFTQIGIPDAVTVIGYGAFSDCVNLTQIVLPDTLTTIEGEAFRGCTSLADIVLSESIMTIGSYAFADCDALTQVTVPAGVRTIENGVFSGCGALSQVQLPDGLTGIGDRAFEECSALTGVTIPDGVTAIGDYAFYRCSALTEAVLPDSVETIGIYAFWPCASLTEVNVPQSLTTLGRYAFSETRLYSQVGSTAARVLGENNFGFRDRAYPGIDLKYIFADGVLTDFAVTGSDEDIVTAVIPSGVTRIGGFNNREALSSVTIPDSVQRIDNSAFNGCIALGGVTLPSGLVSIGSSAFSGCSALEEIVIPAGVSELGAGAFSGCSALERATLPAGIGSLPGGLFQNCVSLAGISIPAGTETIGNYAFGGCTALNSVSLPDSMRTLGMGAFHGCSSLTGINLPDGLAVIDGIAFEECTALKTIYLTDTVTRVGEGAFSSCTALEQVRLSSGMTEIADSLFSACYSLQKVNIPDTILTIGSYAFRDCTALSAIEFPASLQTFEDSAFTGCTNLTAVTIPESVTQLPYSLFYACPNLQKILIPESVTTFGPEICSHTPTIYCYEYSEADYWAQSNGYPVVYLDGKDPDELRSISLSASELTLERGESAYVALSIFPYASNDPVFWLSSDDSVATVNGGTIYAVGDGTAVITVEVGTLTAQVTVTVYTKAEDFRLPDEIWAVVKEPEVIPVLDVMPEGANISLTWESSDTNVATVDENGTVNGRKPNNDVVITATTDDGIARRTTVHICYPVTAIEFAEENLSVTQGDIVSLTANVTARTSTYVNKLVYFSSSDDNRATVDENGNVVTLLPGDVTITAYRDDYSDSVTIHISCAEHMPEIDPEISPTCDTPGLTEGSHCPECGEILTPQEEIPPIGHAWDDPVYEWSEDNSSVTATRVCLNDGSHVESETVAVTAEVVREPDCENYGETSYTSAEFENPVFEVQSKTAVDIEPLGHEWGDVTYEWSEDNSSVTATRVCARDDGHVESETVTTQAAVTREAGCETNSETTYTSAEFENPAFEVQTKIIEHNDALGHDWGEPTYEWAEDNSSVIAARVCAYNAEHVETETAPVDAAVTKDPTCEEKGETTYTCAAFANPAFAVQSRTVADIEALGHDWSAATYEWSEDHGSLTATRFCIRDRSHVESETVSVEAAVTRAATCETKGETTYTSGAFANPAFEVQTETLENIEALGHDWSAPTYEWDEDNKTVTATRACGHDAAHTESETVLVETAVTRAATCETKGETTYTSAVFENAAFEVQSKTLEDIEALGHDWSTPTYEWSEDNSAVTATRVCGHDASHVETETATVTAEVIRAATCEAKGETTYTSAEFTNPAFEVQTKTLEDIEALGHDWSTTTYEWPEDNSYVTATRVCGHDASHVEREAVIVEAEVTRAATCETKGETTYTSGAFANPAFEVQSKTLEDIEALGHDWSAPTYEWSDDSSSVTATRVCGHDASHIERETVAATTQVTKVATCEDRGETTYTSDAFENPAFKVQSKSLENIEALGHDWSLPTYEWAEDNSYVTATRVCSHDASHVESETVVVTTEITKAATCETKGETTYTSAEFTNPVFEVQSKTLEDIDALGHDWSAPMYEWSEDNSSVTATWICMREIGHVETETVGVTGTITKAPTCETKGETTYTSGAFQNPTFEVQSKTLEDVDALGHDWSVPTYEWSEDNSSVTATRVCGHDVAHVESETVGVMTEVTRAATCEDKGDTTYTSVAFENSAFEIQSKTLEDIDALGHDWSAPTYEWSEDNSLVTATRVCGHDASHVEGETVVVTTEVTRAATCEAKGETTYTSAAFENPAFEVQSKTLEDIEALGHDWSAPTYEWSEDNRSVTATRICMREVGHIETETVGVTGKITKAATCEAKGETTYTSAAFGNRSFEIQSKTLEDVKALGHSWSDPIYEWSEDNSSVTATRVCGHDASHVETETVAVTAEVAESPTDSYGGSTRYTAVFVNQAFVKQEKTVFNIPALPEMNVLRLPANLKEIEEEAFAYLPCEGVIIPDGCTTIGSRAFAECTNLKYVRVPASVTNIAEDAFAGCDHVIIDRSGY